MPVEKGKVKAALDVKFKGKSISKNLKEKLAEKWASKIDTEEDIDGYINDREDVILEAMADKDSAVTAAVQKAKSEAAASITGGEGQQKQDQQATPELGDDAPAWAKALLQQNQQLTEQFKGLQTANSQKSIGERLKSDPRTKDINPVFYKGRTMPDETGFDAFADELKADFAALGTFQPAKTEMPPGAATPQTGNVKLASKEQLDAVAKQLNL